MKTKSEKIENCSKHKKTIEKYNGKMEELAEDIGNLHYKFLEKLLLSLSIKLFEDSGKDRKAGRERLANALYGASSSIVGAAKNIENAWKISEPYMKEEMQEEPKKQNSDMLWDSLCWKLRHGGMTFNSADDLIEDLKKEYSLTRK